MLSESVKNLKVKLDQDNLQDLFPLNPRVPQKMFMSSDQPSPDEPESTQCKHSAPSQHSHS